MKPPPRGPCQAPLKSRGLEPRSRKDSADSQRYTTIEAFHSIPGLHTRMHDIAAQLVRHHQAGNKVAVAALREEFGLTGEQMADAIQQLQTEVLIGAHRIRR